MLLKDKLKEMQSQHRALLAANFYNYETLEGILIAAQALNQPVILQLTRSSIEYMGLEMAVAMARKGISRYGVEAWVHLDHGDSVDLAKQCLDAGFDSVMIDASEKALPENIKTTTEVVKIAEAYYANVEAELGYIAKLGQDSNKKGFTTPEDAKFFVENTGVNALAVAIGSAHGFYKETPHLQIELLKQIREAVDTPLVLHGSSGIPEEQVRNAVANGICKVNLATEIKNIFMQTLKTDLSTTDEIDLRKVFPHATQMVVELLSKKLKIVSMT